MRTRAGIFLSLLIGVFSLSTSAIFASLANASAAITAFYRLLFTSMVLFPFLILSKKNRTALIGLSKRQWIFGLSSGLLLAIHYVLWFESLNFTSVASSTAIVTLQPLFSILLGYLFFKERLGIFTFIGCVLSIAGCFILSWGDFQTSYRALLGDLLALLAAAVISSYFFIGQIVRKDTPLIPYSLTGYLSSVEFLGLYAFIQQSSFTDYSISTWRAFLGLALISTICGQLIFNLLLKWVPATTISMCILGEPIGTCILAYFVLHETINVQQGAGIAIIITGLLVFFLPAKVRVEDKNTSDGFILQRGRKSRKMKHTGGTENG